VLIRIAFAVNKRLGVIKSLKKSTVPGGGS